MRYLLILLLSGTAAAACMPYTEAPKKIGADTCIAGKVLKVSVSKNGVHFLNFCEDWRNCPFTAVVFPGDLRYVGNVKTLEGKAIEVHGRVRLYQGQAEIIVENARQLGGEAGKLPPLPKNYDVERKGSYSPGSKPKKSSR